MSPPSWTSLPSPFSSPHVVTEPQFEIPESSNFHWLSILHMVMYMFPCYTQLFRTHLGGISWWPAALGNVSSENTFTVFLRSWGTWLKQWDAFLICLFIRQQQQLDIFKGWGNSEMRPWYLHSGWGNRKSNRKGQSTGIKITWYSGVILHHRGILPINFFSNKQLPNQHAWLQTILQSHSHQDSMVLAQRQKYRSMEQNRKPRDKSTSIWSPYLRQRRQRIYNGEKIVSSMSGAGKTGQFHIKE